MHRRSEEARHEDAESKDVLQRQQPIVLPRQIEPPFDATAADKDVVVPKDTDQDGMPDAWEQMHDLDLNNAADGAQIAPGGEFSNVEIYLNSLVGEQSLPQVMIDHAKWLMSGN